MYESRGHLGKNVPAKGAYEGPETELCLRSRRAWWGCRESGDRGWGRGHAVKGLAARTAALTPSGGAGSHGRASS